MAAAALPLLGSLIGAGGQVAGGLLGRASGGQGQNTNYNPYLDYATQAAQYSNLDPLGFGDLNNIPGPIKQLISQIQASKSSDKTRQAALDAIMNARKDPSLLLDPGGKNFTRDQIFQFNKTGAPMGRTVQRSKAGLGGALGLSSMALDAVGHNNDTGPVAAPIQGRRELKTALQSLGMRWEDLSAILERDKEFEARRKRLEDAGVGVNENTIISRSKANAYAQGLLGDAATFGQTGEANGTIGSLLERDNRQMRDLQARIGLLTNFGGMSGAAGVKALTDADLDQNLRVLEQSLGMSSAIQGALNPASAAASASAANGTQAQLNAAQIAAQQASAANQLRQNGEINRGSSLGNAIGSATSSIGSGLSNAAYLSQMGSRSLSNPFSSSSYYDPFSSNGNGIGAFAGGGGQLAPIGGWK